MKLQSWNCKGCTNNCYRFIPGKGTAKYCKPGYEYGENRTEWQGDLLVCLDYTTDQNATDSEIKVHKDFLPTE